MKEQIRIFYFMFVMNIPKVLLQFFKYYQLGDHTAMFKQTRAMVISLTILKILLARPRLIYILIHFLQISRIFFLWLALTHQNLTWGINAHLQLFMFILSGFFGLGRKWGFIYAILNLLPFLIGLVGLSGLTPPFQVFIEEPITPELIVVAILNFGVLLVACYYFHRALFGAIQEKNALNEQLQGSLRTKTNFLSMMSHELRTPLNSVIGMTELLLTDKPKESQKENLNILRFSAESLLSLINNILDFNKIEASKIELESIPFSLPKLLEEISAGFRLKANEKKLNYNLSVDSNLEKYPLLGDPIRLTQILYNLLGNAIKFTSKGQVSLSATIRDWKSSGVTVRFSVCDTGIGLTQQQQQTIFEPFTQASLETTRKFGGTGLGLAITKHLVQLHQAAIHLESQPQQGSHFYFDIHYPTTFVPVDPKSQMQLSSGKLQGVQVLLAEDNEMNVILMKKLLSRWGMLLTIAGDGQQAVEMVQKHFYDVILMDINMPNLDGLQAAKQIKQLTNSQAATTPIIALTATVSVEIATQIKDCGMDEFVGKPFRPDDLYSKLVSVLSN